ncbi:MAG: peptidyl-prolyl cis-trans isomerase [Candidatus Eisenbacteria bacterium]|uniref:Peptidyl-prolyl cis-trans isomerase n=1 Tax=Eiseniibacteriota bacterium TaxID=2212470 RepID=A0A933W950_UNCEI|nr:peptidyl-prolyl cis-trans isomerase [Candidatus Eisenbacteria bacterium]
MTRSFPRAASLALLFALALTSCTAGDRPVAKVGNRLITAAEFERRVQGNEMQYPANPDQARAAALDDLVKGELLLQAARGRGADTSAVYRAMAQQVAERVLAQAISEKLAPPTVAVSEAEARELWSWMAEKADVQMIYAVDEANASAAKAAIDAGQPFADVAMRFSVPGALQNNGNLGLVTPGSLVSPLDQALRSLPIGKPGGPYETPQGFFFVLVKGRQKAEVAPFESLQPALMERLRQRKRMMAMSAALVSIEKAYRGTLVAGAPQLLFRYFTQFRVGEQAPWTPNATERAQVLAKWDGGTLTFGDVLDELNKPEANKPAASVLPAIEAWMRGLMRTRIVIQEARRRHLHEEPAIARRIQAELDEYLAQGEYALAIQNVTQPTDEQAREAWDAMKANYEQLDRAHLQFVVVPDSAKAAQIAMHGGHSGTLAEAVAMADPSLKAMDVTVTFPSNDPELMTLQGRLLRMAPGDWAGPEQVAGGWRLLQLQDKVQGPREYGQLSPEVVQSVKANAWEMARNRHFELYLDSLRTVFKPTPVPENLARVAWPLPRPVGVR